MKRSPNPTPEATIQAVGCTDSQNIDQCLLDTADTEFNKEEGDGPQDIERAFNCLRAILMRHWDNPAPEVQKYVAGALMRRAQVLAHYRQFDDARNDFAEIRTRYEYSSDIEVRRAVAAAFHEAGNMEDKLDNADDAAEWYEAAIELFGNDRDDMVDVQLADIKINLALIYIGRGWQDLANELLDSGIRRWQNHKEYWLRRKVANMHMHRAFAAARDAESTSERAAALSLLDEAIEYADRALGQFIHFLQGTCFDEKVRLLHALDRYHEAVESAELFRSRVSRELRDNPPRSSEIPERFQSHLKNVDLVVAQSLLLLDRLDEALQACDRTGILSGDGEYRSAKEKEFAIGALAVRVITLSRLHRFPAAKRYLFEIYRVAGCNVDESWTDAMVTSVGVAIENLDAALKKAGLTLDEVTIQAGDLPGPS